MQLRKGLTPDSGSQGRKNEGVSTQPLMTPCCCNYPGVCTSVMSGMPTQCAFRCIAVVFGVQIPPEEKHVMHFFFFPRPRMMWWRWEKHKVMPLVQLSDHTRDLQGSDKYINTVGQFQLSAILFLCVVLFLLFSPLFYFPSILLKWACFSQ